MTTWSRCTCSSSPPKTALIQDSVTWWLEKPDSEFLYWRTPTSRGYYDSEPQRPVGRHNKRANMGFVDGHANPQKVSTLGLQFFPGKDSAGRDASEVACAGGNERYDERWMWDRN